MTTARALLAFLPGSESSRGSRLVRLAKRPRSLARRAAGPLRRVRRGRRRERLGLSSRDRRRAGAAARRRDRDRPVARRRVGADADGDRAFVLVPVRAGQPRAVPAGRLLARLRSAPFSRMASDSCSRRRARDRARGSTSSRSRVAATAISAEGIDIARISSRRTARSSPRSDRIRGSTSTRSPAGASSISPASQVGDDSRGLDGRREGPVLSRDGNPAASTSSTSPPAAARMCAISPEPTPPA